MNLPGSALTWQTVAAILAALVAAVSGIAVVKAALEQKARADDTKGWLTGGDSFPHLYPVTSRTDKGDNAVIYFVKHRGNYPLYDVQVRLQDLDNGPFLPDGSVIPSQIGVAGTLTSNTDKFPIHF